MIRDIRCRNCAFNGTRLSQEDEAQGWKHRTRFICLNREVQCDSCSDPIPSGTLSVASTMWTGDYPNDWEEEFGTILSAENVSLIDTLSGTEHTSWQTAYTPYMKPTKEPPYLKNEYQRNRH